MFAPNRWQRVTAAEAKRLLQRDGLRIFDMRDQAAFSEGHIEGAQYLSNANLEDIILKTPKDQPILIYCYRGNASQTGARIFADFGFSEVYELAGGYEGWRRTRIHPIPEES